MSNSHERKCRDCGNVAVHEDNVTPWVNCRACGSQDTRLIRKPIPIEEEIEGLLSDLRTRGFAAAKRIAKLRGLGAGSMRCPLCQRELKYFTAANGHFRAK
jgi:DNA-directed RNA polymerase subunit RPC12/RpoP